MCVIVMIKIIKSLADNSRTFAHQVKRILSILLLSIFIFSTVGVIANSYSCNMKEMKGNMCCSNSCCKHEVKLLKVHDDFVSSVSFSLPRNFSPSVTLITPGLSKNNFLFSHFLFSEDDHAPPGKIVDRLSFIQSFLI